MGFPHLSISKVLGKLLFCGEKSHIITLENENPKYSMKMWFKFIYSNLQSLSIRNLETEIVRAAPPMLCLTKSGSLAKCQAHSPHLRWACGGCGFRGTWAYMRAFCCQRGRSHSSCPLLLRIVPPTLRLPSLCAPSHADLSNHAFWKIALALNDPWKNSLGRFGFCWTNELQQSRERLQICEYVAQN